MRSIRSRLIASYLLVTLLAMGAAAGLAWNALDRAFLDVLRENLLAQARLVAQTVESGGTGNLVIPGAEPAPGPDGLTNYVPRVIDDEGAVILAPAAVPTASETLAPPFSPEPYSQAANVRLIPL